MISIIVYKRNHQKILVWKQFGQMTMQVFFIFKS